MQLQDKVIILTGAARIGVEVAKALSGKGARLAVTYLNNQPDLSSLPNDVFYIKGDLSHESEVKRIVSEIKKHYGQIDALVHMAATYNKNLWKTVSEKDFDDSMNAIAKSAFLMSKATADEITNGKIIFISDWSVLTQPYKDYLPYNVAKSAVVGLTKSLAKELAPKIAVNCVAPGPILKPPGLSDEEDAEVLQNTPLARWGGSEEIAKAVLFLLDSEFITGQVIYVDGGRSIA
jgi:pteridine reductase